MGWKGRATWVSKTYTCQGCGCPNLKVHIRCPAPYLYVTGEDELAEKAIAQLASSNARLAEYHKDWSSALTKYGKTVEKVKRNEIYSSEHHPNVSSDALQKFNVDLTPILPAVTSTSVEDEDSQMFFSSNENKRTIDNVLAMHFVRSGKDALAQTFLKVSRTGQRTSV